MIRASPYSSWQKSYSASVTISLSVQERPLASYRCQSAHGIDTRKFHGSFRLCFRLFAFPYSLMLISKDCFSKLPYRYFNEFLVLYSDFSDSRQISLLRISSQYVVSHTTHITGLFLHSKRLFYADHKDSAIDFSMMIHCKALLMVSVFTNGITPSGKNQLIQYLEQAYLVTFASRQD